MGITAAEQLLLEYINRARLDPKGEALRLRDVEGTAPSGTLASGGQGDSRIPNRALDPLAINDKLAIAADRHAGWMLAEDRFSHTGKNGSSAGERIADAGYDYRTWAENIAFRGLSGSSRMAEQVEVLHRNLFASDDHRANMLARGVTEVGTSVRTGDYLGMNAAIAAQNYARQDDHRYITGVVYRDRDGDDFYSIGEGRGGLAVRVGGEVARSQSSGGYSLDIGSGGGRPVVKIAGGTFRILDRDGSVKIDLVNGSTVESSASLDLLGGARHAGLLGGEDLSIRGNARGNQLTGNDGDNRLLGERGADRLSGEGGADRLTGGLGGDRLDGGAGRDRLTGGRGNDRMSGDGGTDTLIGGQGRDSLSGGAGQDVLKGGSGRDRIFGGAQDDRILGGSGNDRLSGGEGRDKVLGSSGRDKLDGGGGHDRLSGGRDADTLSGGSGRDRLDGGHGQDRLKGGTGDDALLGGRGNDVLRGQQGDDRILGGDGFDTLLGDHGRDRLIGGDGNDSLSGGRMGDVMSGGHGADRMFGGHGGDVMRGGLGADRLVGGAGDDRMWGDAGDDTLDGGSGDDFLSGGSGNDGLDGGIGADRLFGGDGDDDLRGGDDADRLVGGAGNDRLDGGAGDDALVGGSGEDVFVFTEGHDRVSDFETAEDRLELSRALWVEEMSAEDIVATYASETEDGLVLDFGEHRLTLEGLTDAGALAAVIDIA